MVFKMALLFVLEKKTCICIFSWKIYEVFEVMKMIFKKCIRIVKGTSNLTSTMYVDFVI